LGARHSQLSPHFQQSHLLHLNARHNKVNVRNEKVDHDEIFVYDTIKNMGIVEI